MPHDVAEMTLIPRPSRGREAVPVQLRRLLHAHEIVLKEVRAMARQAADANQASGIPPRFHPGCSAARELEPSDDRPAYAHPEVVHG